ncbi:GPI ethanolamine phosphate transferase 2 isoform X2 [Erythrolamprus reginae]|uniref:GPI ethanolamine phosphate transferase 2 isoform X2 n=1 Tax=Erythrolamprus reginae TaxID=121349 RepID=UPI00396CB973
MRVRSGVFASFCLLVQALGVGLFLRGFFPVPVRSLLPSGSFGQVPAEPPQTEFISKWTKTIPPIFNKVVIVLIDALRDDFVFGSKGLKFMPYTTDLVEKGTTHAFIAEAKAPTVTMPRIKALMTGSIPGFIDVIMNLNSPALMEDNLIWQAKIAGKRIIFYGDDTWIRLFPKHFVEYDGTTSFFVSDYTEVDNNVTRHLNNVLKREDWDILILHYLGLDHIGHLTGPNSPLIGPKLSEMDNIISKIHKSLLSKEVEEETLPNLLVVCGDHGMSETGNHGGSSESEIRTPSLFVSSAFQRTGGSRKYPELIQQTDVAVTLALGLGLPISRNSVGKLLSPVIEWKTAREQLRLLHLNGFQLSKLLQENVPAYEKDPGFEMFVKAEKSHGNWIQYNSDGTSTQAVTNLSKKIIKQYLEALKMLSSSLSKQVAQYDIYSMIVGTMIILEVLLLLFLSLPKALTSRAEFEIQNSPLCSPMFYSMCLIWSAIHVVVCTSTESLCYFCSIPWIMATGVIMLVSGLFWVIISLLEMQVINSRQALKNPAAAPSSWSELDVLILAGTIGHISSLGASSFIEEEHQTWYFLINTLCLALCQEICRHYFLTKDGDLQIPTTGKAKAEEEMKETPSYYRSDIEITEEELKMDRQDNPVSVNTFEKWMALATPWLILIICRVLRSLNQTGVQWAHRPDFGHWLTRGTTEARFVYIFVLGIIFTGTKDLFKSLFFSTKIKFTGLWEIYGGLVLLSALLLRPHNLPVLVLCLLIQTMMRNYIWKPLEFDAAQVTIMHYWFGQAFFFFQGNSNGIASVDVSAGFVGLTDYVEIPAIFLTALATYSGPLLWAIHLLCYLSSEVDRNPAAIGHGCFCYALLRSIPVTVYILLITGLRYHLFIWSVFSPKLLYEGVHTFLTAAVCTFFTVVDHQHWKH